jgi:hypothetical protein
MLVINSLGRPVEFHCSTPVRPTRTQEVLYGQTLQQYLSCDLIGRAMLKHCRGNHTVVVVRQNEMAALTAHTDRPLAVIAQRESQPATEEAAGTENPVTVSDASPMARVLGKPDDQVWAEQALLRLGAVLPLDEPFGRIDEAIREAHAAGRRTTGISEAA